MEQQPNFEVRNEGENIDTRFKQGIRLDLARAGYDALGEYAIDMTQTYQTSLHNHPAVWSALLKVATEMETSFDTFEPAKVQQAISELRAAIDAEGDSFGPGIATDIGGFVEQYATFAGRLA
ncbi:MAG: hypothetical protein MUF19_01180 [Candidatus Pacebacteria bacterium]|jgi:ABC-type transporter Mla subunit MlaD|nr:hypothetical protein [Candidatus Paceibacterota bacterium]